MGTTSQPVAVPGRVEYRAAQLLRHSDSAVANPPGTPALMEYRTTRARHSNPLPQSEQCEFGQGRWVPASPSTEYRPSPLVQYRTVTTTTAAACAAPVAPAPGAPVLTSSSPVSRMRADAPLNCSSVATSSYTALVPAAVAPAAAASPKASSPSPQLELATPEHDDSCQSIALAATEDVAVQKTVAMLPPTPGNTLLDFLHGVVAGEVEPAMCCVEPWIDAVRYWEKRRVQNSLRRLLEALQQVFGVDGDTPAATLGGLVFDELLRRWPGCSLIDEDAFVQGVEALGGWPPELLAADRSEVFAALRVPMSAAVRGLSAGLPLPRELSRRLFCQGLVCLPYNVPDFPVPIHLLGSTEGRPAPRELAEAVASVFAMEQTGLERAKDFFLCGLISLEEIQAALPRLLPERLVEDAVMRVIRRGSEHFTTREWQTLVVSLRVAPEAELAAGAAEQPAEPQPAPAPPQPRPPPGGEQLPSLASPAPRYRQVAPPSPVPDTATSALAVSAADQVATPPEDPVAFGGGLGTPGQRPLVAMTDLLSCREVRSEEPVRFQACPRLIDWSTSLGGANGRDYPGGAPGHQADEGAGMRPAGQELSQSQGPPVVSVLGRGEARDHEAVRLISLDLHNECLGPFLARAFVRCCQLYEAHCMDFNGSQ